MDTKSKQSTTFIVENGFNTCYMDSLFMALFYAPSHIEDSLLKYNPKKDDYIYLQELIRAKFVEQVRKGQSVTSETINEIRNYSYVSGWRNNEKDIDELLEQQDINEYYTFLMDIFNCQSIEVQRETISEGIPIKGDVGNFEKLPFIPLALPSSKTEVRIKDLLHNWFFDNPVEIKRQIIDKGVPKTTTVGGLNTFRITNIPSIIGLAIPRFVKDMERITTKVDIQKKIKPLQNCGDERFSSLIWSFHAMICHKGTKLKMGHYYAVINVCNKWFVFDDLHTPCMSEIHMNDKEVMDTIKTECVFVIYKRQDVAA